MLKTNSDEFLYSDAVSCPNGHLFYVEYHNGDRHTIIDVFPQEYIEDIPAWLPETHKDCYLEILKAKKSSMHRSLVATSAILLEATINEMFPNEGEKKKSLYDRLEILRSKGKIDADQFSSGTITRLTRKGVVHPEDLVSAPTAQEAQAAFEEVYSFLERTFKYRSSRALPSPAQSESES